MSKKISITCPVCKLHLDANCYEDPSVGIPFDFDVLETSGCQCEGEDSLDAPIALAVQDAYWQSFELCDPIGFVI